MTFVTTCWMVWSFAEKNLVFLLLFSYGAFLLFSLLFSEELCWIFRFFSGFFFYTSNFLKECGFSLKAYVMFVLFSLHFIILAKRKKWKWFLNYWFLYYLDIFILKLYEHLCLFLCLWNHEIWCLIIHSTKFPLRNLEMVLWTVFNSGS